MPATFNRRLSLAAAAVALMLLSVLAVTGPAGAAGTGDNPCPQPYYPLMGDFEATAAEVPDLADPGHEYPALVLKPTDTARYPGKRPVIVLQHGLGGNRCGEWWRARILAGSGYVVETHTAVAGATTTESYVNAVRATRAAIAFMKSPSNPYATISDTSRLGLGGHSMGSIVTSSLQGDTDLGIDAALASDSIRRWTSGDPAAAAGECKGTPAGEVTPRVPTLSFAKDEPCDALPDVTSADLKLPGFLWWREHQIPTMQLVMRGFTHSDFGATEANQKLVAHFMVPWFRLYLDGDQSQVDQLLSRTIDGQPAADALSEHYLSGAYIEPRVDSSDFAGWLKTPEPKLTGKANITVSSKAIGRARPGKRFRVKVTVKNTGDATFHNLRLRPMVTHSLSWRPRDVILKNVKPGIRKVHEFSIHVRGTAPKRSRMSVRILSFEGWSDKRVAPKVTIFRHIR